MYLLSGSTLHKILIIIPNVKLLLILSFILSNISYKSFNASLYSGDFTENNANTTQAVASGAPVLVI